MMLNITVLAEMGSPGLAATFEITPSMGATMVADPLTVLHCSPITDGAAAAVLAPLLGAADLLTPNLPELAALTGLEVGDDRAAVEAAEERERDDVRTGEGGAPPT